MDGITTWELLKATIRCECMLYSGNKDYENWKNKLEIAELAITKGAIVRSRIKWMEEGERNKKNIPQFREKKEQQSTQSVKLKMKKGEYVNIPPKFYQRFRNIHKCGGTNERLYARYTARSA